MKVGIFGGTFNPIHVGHAIIASHIVQHCDIDKLWLMVSPLNPFKVNQGEQIDTHRLRMAEMVSRRLDNVETSAFEFSLPRPSYTLDTLKALQAKFPDDEFILIIGADNWDAFDRWRDHEEILQRFRILVYPRQGYDISIPPHLQHQVEIVDAPMIEVSSTSIRQEIKQQGNVSFYLPDEVYHYILRNQLYLE